MGDQKCLGPDQTLRPNHPPGLWICHFLQSSDWALEGATGPGPARPRVPCLWSPFELSLLNPVQHGTGRVLIGKNRPPASQRRGTRGRQMRPHLTLGLTLLSDSITPLVPHLGGIHVTGRCPREDASPSPCLPAWSWTLLSVAASELRQPRVCYSRGQGFNMCCRCPLQATARQRQPPRMPALQDVLGTQPGNQSYVS